jgi:hypothetical protein
MVAKAPLLDNWELAESLSSYPRLVQMGEGSRPNGGRGRRVGSDRTQVICESSLALIVFTYSYQS